MLQRLRILPAFMLVASLAGCGPGPLLVGLGVAAATGAMGHHSSGSSGPPAPPTSPAPPPPSPPTPPPPPPSPPPPPGPPPGPPTQVLFGGGNNQTGAAGTALPEPLVVVVVDVNGIPVPNVPVSWNGDGVCSPTSGSTDAFGRAQTIYTLLATPKLNGIAAIVTFGGGMHDADFTETGVVGPPAKLDYTVAPSGGTTIGLIAPAINVTVEDQFGNVVTSATNAITLSIAANPGGATLQGTTTRSATPPSGHATFFDIFLDKPGSGYTLTAASNGLLATTSAPFDVVAASPVWQGVARPAAAHAFSTAAVGPDGLVYVSGTGDAVGTRTVEAYDPTTDVWTTAPDLLAPRRLFTFATGPDGRIYALGGEDSVGTIVSRVDAYDTTSKAWTAVASMPTPRYLLGAVSANHKLYALGGYRTSFNGLGPNEAYDPSSDTWTTLSPIPTGDYIALAVALAPDGRIWCIGGSRVSPVNGNFDAPPDVNAYDASLDRWNSTTSPPQLSTGRWGLAAVTASDGRVYAVGGITGPGTPDQQALVEVYSPGTGTWTKAPSLLTCRGVFGAVASPDGRVLAVGGVGADNSSLDSAEALGPHVTLSPTQGAAGTSVSVSGSNFGFSATVDVYWIASGSFTFLASGSADSKGTISGLAFTVPASAASGTYAVSVKDGSSGFVATAPFTVP